MTRSRSQSLLLAGLLAPLMGCAFAGMSYPKAAAETNATLSRGDVVLAPGDTIRLQVLLNPDWDTTIVVGADGKASFPFLEDVPVAGLTLGQLDNSLEASYASKLDQPEVTLNVVTYGGREVIVMGEVRDPGAIPIASDRMTLVDALGRAGGPLKETALLKQVILVRWLPQEGRRRSWKIDARIKWWNGPEELYLQPYDVVFVPNTPIDDVGIWVDMYIRRLIPIPAIVPAAGGTL